MRIWRLKISALLKQLQNSLLIDINDDGDNNEKAKN